MNRGGARFIVELFKVDQAGVRLNERFGALKDAEWLDLAPGARVSLEPGESLTLDALCRPCFLGGRRRGSSGRNIAR